MKKISINPTYKGFTISYKEEYIPKKRCLITGHTGSIGIHLVSHIMKNTNWDIVGIDSFQHKGYKDRLDFTLKQHPDWKSRIKSISHNLTCPISTTMKNEIGDVDYIIHLAAMSDVFFSVENPVWVIKNNIDSTLVMLEYAKETPHEAFIYFSTDEVYGAVETPRIGHKEWETHRPSNAYSASKAASEDLCYCYWRSGDVKLVITNTMNNFGEMQSGSKFPVMVQKALNEDKFVTIHGNEKEIGTRFYIHSRNASDALLYILNNLPVHEHEIGKIDDPDRYNIVGDVCLDNLELAKRISKIMDKPLSYRLQDFHSDNPAHDIHYGLNGSKLESLGWKSPVSFDESMKNTIEWQQEHQDWIK